MSKTIMISMLMLITAGLAGWYLLKGQPAAMPGAQATNVVQQDKNLDPNKHDFFDVDFAQKMIVHHQQGIVIADTLLAASTNSDIRAVATNMREQQAGAEQQYKLWLNEWNETYRNLADFPQMDGHDMYPSFPGVVSAAKLSNLKSAVGEDQDKQFLAVMIEHHGGGIQLSEMSNKLQYKKLIDFKNKVASDYKSQLQEMEKV